MAGYGTDAEFASWLAGRGLVLPTGSAVPAVLRLLGSEYVDGAYEAKLHCSARSGGIDQERAWPRVGASVRNELIPVDVVPKAWIQASFRAAYLEALTPGWSAPNANAMRLTKREKADVVEREFFSGAELAKYGAAPGYPVDASIDGVLSQFFCPAPFDGGLQGILSIGS